MKKQINFADVKSAEEFRTRFDRYHQAHHVNGKLESLKDENGNPVLSDCYYVSVGCYWPHLKQFMTKERVREDQLRVNIEYSKWTGTECAWRFV